MKLMFMEELELGPEMFMDDGIGEAKIGETKIGEAKMGRGLISSTEADVGHKQ